MGLGGKTLRPFAIGLAVAVGAIAAFAAVLAGLVRWDFLAMWAALLVAIGGLYVLSAILAWTGFANLYRFSPTMFVALRSFRQTVLTGPILREGRDAAALARGLAFGGALVGIGAALYAPFFVLVDLVVLVPIVAFVLVVRATAVRSRT